MLPFSIAMFDKKCKQKTEKQGRSMSKIPVKYQKQFLSKIKTICFSCN